MIARNPVERADAPSQGKSTVGTVLDQEQLTALVNGFRNRVLFPIVAVAAFTGARRNEILALRWSDFDMDKKTLRIERSIEATKAHGRRTKGPKTARGCRTIAIDGGLVELLRAERVRHLRIKAGVPDGAEVDLSLVRLPEIALMFPAPPAPGESFDFGKLRYPGNVTREFEARAGKLGFPMRFHDLRGTHETLLLDGGTPVHVVAERCGHDPAVLLRSYAKRTHKADTSAAAAIGVLSQNVLGSNLGPKR